MNMIKALKVFARHKIRCRITETIDDYAEENIKTANEIKKKLQFWMRCTYTIEALRAKVTS